MFELALSFKGRPLSVHALDRPRLIVGRHPDCDLVIDSLAVAPQHLALQIVEQRVVLVALTADHPVLRNGRRVSHAVLEEGDRILVGKHTLALARSSAAPEEASGQGQGAPTGRPRRPPTRAPAASPEPVDAYLQIQSGEHIGEILTLTRAVTRLRRIGGAEVILSRRGSGYCLSRLGEANRVAVEGEPVLGNQEVPLAQGTHIEIDGVRCQFFQGLASTAA